MSVAADLEKGKSQKKEAQLLIKNLKLLRIDPLQGVSEDDFRGKNASITVRSTLHGLYCVFDRKAAEKSLNNVWPVYPGESDRGFRAAIFTWVSMLQENPTAAPFLEGFSAGLLLRPATPQFLTFLTGLSTFLLQDRLKDKIELASSFSHELLPRNVIKFVTQQEKSRCVSLQKQLSEIEADCADEERHLKGLLSNLRLSLCTLKAEAETYASDESVQRLSQMHKELRDQNRLISTRMMQIEEHCEVMDGIITLDLVGGLNKCSAISDKFMKGYNKRTCEDQRDSITWANMHLDALKRTVQHLQAQRQTLEMMKADTKQRLEDAIDCLPAEILEESGIKTTASITRFQVNVEDFIEKLSAAFTNHSSKQK
ncbi:uncharacterized protein LOC119436961 isoform X2 [Dermacentor silvarum]|nr:uncharacterized protein LOC119436961 isoform X2 [Dermacentor silvarum]